MADDPETLLAQRAAEWSGWIAEGRLGQVLKSIDSLPSSMDAEKPFLRIQTFHRAGLHGPALEALEVLAVNEDADHRALLKLARISADAGAAQLAARFLTHAADHSTTIQDLEAALAAAVEIGNRGLQRRIAGQLRQVFPESAELKRLLVRDLVGSGDYGAAAMALRDEPGVEDAIALFVFLHEALGTDGTPDYRAVWHTLAGFGPAAAARGQEALVRDALRRGRLAAALDIALLETAVEHRVTIAGELLLDVVEAVLLAAEDDRDGLKAAVVQVVRYLAERPTDGSARLRLTRLLSPEMSGTLGVAIIASASLDLLHSAPVTMLTAPRHGMSAGDLLEHHRPFVDRAFQWLQSEAPIVLGRSVLPASLLTENADEIASGVTDALVSMTRSINDDSDVTALLTWLSLGASLAPHTSQPAQDLALMRLCAGALARAGRVQRARDLAENALYAAGSDPTRRRLAWSVMADVYHRVGNNLESLIALTCAAVHRTAVDEQEIWYEADCLVRTLRDLGLHDLARQELENSADLLRRMGWWEANRHRHRFMQLQIDMSQLLRESRRPPEALETLVVNLVENADEVLARNDDPAAVTTMLGQLVRLAQESGVTLSPETHNTLQRLLDRTATATASFIRAVSSERLTKDDLLRLHQRTDTARYADDVGYDAQHAAIAARRFLTDEHVEHDPYAAAFAIELLADRAVPSPGWEVTARPPDSIVDTFGPGRLAEQISSTGISVVLSALDDTSRLVSVTAFNGRLGHVAREDREVFSGEALESWGRQFPRRYGLDNGTPNLFFVSTEHLRVSKLPEGRVVLVSDPELQRLPPNLLRVDDEFAGTVRPMAAAPSLSWLTAARKAPSPLSGRRVAWISTDEQHGHTLAMLAERLGPTLADYSIDLDVGGVLPSGFTGSDIAIVAAHGGLAPEGRFFHRISDEGGLVLAASDVARLLRNVGVVILFICSGGRADPHPAANTTVGLVRQVLHSGCASAIASPWPLDARVASHWLPAFMASWSGGSPLIDANFDANKVVATAFSNDLASSLALNVYGDPLRMFPVAR